MNKWDNPPSKQNDQSFQLNPSATSPSAIPAAESGVFFRPPPTPEIPEELRQQGHYRRVTGEDPAGAAPSPDRKQVKNVFPWEEKPRPLPARKFPDYDAPEPEKFEKSPESGSGSSQADGDGKEERSPPRLPLSPSQGLPFSLTYPNAWDTVPSIQRYAERLVRPPAPAPLAPAFDSEEWKRTRGGRSWEERSEANSRDGDDEDDGDEADEKGEEHRKWTEVNDHEDGHTVSPGGTARARTRRDSSSVSASYIVKKKEYRVRGVQTIPREMRSQGIQVSIVSPKVPQDQSNVNAPKGSPMSSSVSRGGGRKQWMPANAPVSVGISTSTSELPMTTAFPSPIQTPSREGLPPSTPPGMRSPREFAFPPHTVPGTVRAVPRPATATAPIPARRRQGSDSPISMSRQVSNDGSSLTSPPSSVGPVSPREGQPIGLGTSPGARKGGRVWDPARGVELFKRGSEEVLARFLKMSTWEDENAQAQAQRS